MEEQIKQLRKIFDLSAYEAKIYLAALKFENINLTDLAQKAGIPRTASYAPIKKLLKEDYERCISEVVEAVNTARIGAIIDDSEEPVRMATSRLRQMIFQKAIQMKTNAAEAAFSPSQEHGQV